jgi:sarcinarray family protein
MIRKSKIVLFIILSINILVTPLTQAGGCAYGSVQAWFRTTEGVWVNATAHPSLHRGESFEIKVRVNIATDLRVVYLKLHEFGTPVYEGITGPSTMEQFLENWELTMSNQSWTSVWNMRVKANTSWVNGSSPLELYVQFTKNDYDDASVMFDILNAFIVDSLWENYSPKPNLDDVSLKNRDTPRLSNPSFIGVVIVVFLSGVLLWSKRKKEK